MAGRSDLSIDEPTTPWADVTSYNNFYEFGVRKGDPVTAARRFRTRPWTVSIEGEVHKPRMVDIEEILRFFPLEERVYRMRCVEAWSMVIPWVGFPLAALLKRFGPTSRAHYVELTTLLDPEQMPVQRGKLLPWPYVEALSGCRSPALEPGHGAPDRRGRAPAHPALQRLRRAGRRPLRGHGPPPQLLNMSRGATTARQPWLKPGVFVGALVPFLALLVRARRGDLGANPIAEALNQFGLLALVFLLASLAGTPLKTLVGWVWPIRLRRMLGLFAFFYALVHA